MGARGRFSILEGEPVDVGEILLGILKESPQWIGVIVVVVIFYKIWDISSKWMEMMVQVIQSNTEAMTKLSERLGHLLRDGR